jgi:large conductance mechanosensitive channel
MLREFRGFLTQSNAFALAVGVIIGAATTKLVSAVADDVIMPIIGTLLPSGQWRTAKLVLKDQNAILYGHLLGTILDFLIIAWIVFLITKWILRPAGKPETRPCPQCLETILVEAKRCKWCTAVL